jgi:pyruvate,orthophosphate dikinase
VAEPLIRPGLMIPELYALQARAITEAAAICRQRGGDPRPEIMIPLIGSVREFIEARHGIAAETELVVGTMIETPRAALTAGKIALYADFFSFGTNDLTQLTWGFSRDDVESAFSPATCSWASSKPPRSSPSTAAALTGSPRSPSPKRAKPTPN